MFDSTFWYFLRLMISLPIVLALAYFGTKFILSRSYFQIGQRYRAIKLVDRLQIGPKSSISIVEINGLHYIIASNDNSITLLKELDDFEAIEIPEIKGNDFLQGINFREILDKNLSKVKSKLRRGRNN